MDFFITVVGNLRADKNYGPMKQIHNMFENAPQNRHEKSNAVG